MAPPPVAAQLLTNSLMVAVASIAVLRWKSYRGVPWPAFGLGALAWIVGVTLKVAWALLTNPLVQGGLDHALPAWASRPALWLYIGLLTGVFECGIALLFVMRTGLREAGWDQAMAFGIGFGAMEAFLLGLLGFASVLFAIVLPDEHDAGWGDALAGFTRGGVITILLPVIERISALIAHTLACVLVVFGVRTGAFRWFWAAFAYKTAMDAFAAWVSLGTRMTNSIAGMVAAEVAAGTFAVLGLVALGYLKSRFDTPAASEPAQSLAG